MAIETIQYHVNHQSILCVFLWIEMFFFIVIISLYWSIHFILLIVVTRVRFASFFFYRFCQELVGTRRVLFWFLWFSLLFSPLKFLHLFTGWLFKSCYCLSSSIGFRFRSLFDFCHNMALLLFHVGGYVFVRIPAICNKDTDITDYLSHRFQFHNMCWLIQPSCHFI